MNPELMAALFGASIIVAAIFVTLMQKRSAGQMSKLAVRPKLAIERKEIPETPLKIILHNSGAGNAYIEQIEILIDGITIPADIKSTVENAVSHLGLSGYDVICFMPSKGEAIQPGQKSALIEANPIDAKEYEKISSAFERLSFRIKYKSACDEKFVAI